MAIDIIGTFGGYYLQYDTDTNEYIVNPEGDSLVLVSLGFNNTRLTQSALSALHDGNSVFSGRSDFAGDVNKFPLVILDNTKALSNTMKEQLKRYVDRDPVLSYTGLTSFYESESGTSVDVTILVDAGMVYASSFTETLTFTAGDYRDYTFNVLYTDLVTGRSAEYELVVSFAETVGYDYDAVNMWLFGQPNVGISGIYTVDTGGYSAVKDVIADDGDFLQTLEERRIPQAQSEYLKLGCKFALNKINQMSKVRTGSEGWNLAEHCFVLQAIAPINFGVDFEATILQFDFNNRPLQLRNTGTVGKYNVGNKSSWSPTFLDKGIPQTFICGRDSTGNFRIDSSSGASLVISNFNGWPLNNLFLGYFSGGSTTKVCDALIHEISVLPYYPDENKRTLIYERGIERWFSVIQEGDSNLITEDNFSLYTDDNFDINVLL
jgi:hypothetical protein